MSVEFESIGLGTCTARDSNNNEFVLCDDNKTVYINDKPFLYSDLTEILNKSNELSDIDEELGGMEFFRS